MVEKTSAVLKGLKEEYEIFERELLEQRLNSTEEHCRVGAPFGVEITWTQNDDANILKVFAYGGGVHFWKEQEQTQDVMFINKEIIKENIIPEQKPFISQNMEEYEFGRR